jgi:hypothetical protein
MRVSVLLRSQVVSFAGQDLGWIRRVCEEQRLVAHGPGIPAGFLFDDGADQRGFDGLRGGGSAGHRDEMEGASHARDAAVR